MFLVGFVVRRYPGWAGYLKLVCFYRLHAVTVKQTSRH